jgi:hypothetical protein
MKEDRRKFFSWSFMANTFGELSVNDMGSKQNFTTFMKTPFPARYILYRATVSMLFCRQPSSAMHGKHASVSGGSTSKKLIQSNRFNVTSFMWHKINCLKAVDSVTFRLYPVKPKGHFM